MIVGIQGKKKERKHLTRARRVIYEIIKTLRNLGCSSPSLFFFFLFSFFFLLFDAQILISLLYDSELWGIKAHDSIGKVHIKPVSCFRMYPTPFHDMMYGELGRFPQYIQAAARCLQYWFRLGRQPLCRYSRKAYDMLYITGGSCHKYHFFVATNTCFRDKTRHLSRQKYACQGL